MKKIELREFTDADWDGYAGAERPEPWFASKPLIGEMVIDGYDAQVIVDRHGVSIESHGGSWATLTCPFPVGRLVAQQLNAEGSYTANEIRMLGFTPDLRWGKARP